MSPGGPPSTRADGQHETHHPAPIAPFAALSAPLGRLTEEQALAEPHAAAADVAMPSCEPAEYSTCDSNDIFSTNGAGRSAVPFSMADEAGQCVVCWEADADVLFRPCGHACMSCAQPFMFAAPCPVCRAHVEEIMILEEQ